MKFYDISFFCDDKIDAGPKVRINTYQDLWPITLTINTQGTQYDTPRVYFHMSERQLIQFKNSVISAYESYLKLKGSSNE